MTHVHTGYTEAAQSGVRVDTGYTEAAQSGVRVDTPPLPLPQYFLPITFFGSCFEEGQIKMGGRSKG